MNDSQFWHSPSVTPAECQNLQLLKLWFWIVMGMELSRVGGFASGGERSRAKRFPRLVSIVEARWDVWEGAE